MTLLSCLTCFCNNSFPGFQKEADSLLSVTKLSIISDSQNMSKARDILLKLSEETNIFPTSWELSERYLFVVVSTLSTFPPFRELTALQGAHRRARARGCSDAWWHLGRSLLHLELGYSVSSEMPVLQHREFHILLQMGMLLHPVHEVGKDGGLWREAPGQGRAGTHPTVTATIPLVR